MEIEPLNDDTNFLIRIFSCINVIFVKVLFNPIEFYREQLKCIVKPPSKIVVNLQVSTILFHFVFRIFSKHQCGVQRHWNSEIKSTFITDDDSRNDVHKLNIHYTQTDVKNIEKVKMPKSKTKVLT